jgi:hypothetical protein
MVGLKTQYEIDIGLKFSKNGLINYIENFIENESTVKDKRWEETKLNMPGIKIFLKRGGSDINK